MKKTKLTARFGPETGFELRPRPARAYVESRFEELKRGLLDAKLDALWDRESRESVRRAAHEASAVAWLTAFPLLFYPELFAEKAATALAVARRQAEVREHSRELLAL